MATEWVADSSVGPNTIMRPKTMDTPDTTIPGGATPTEVGTASKYSLNSVGSRLRTRDTDAEAKVKADVLSEMRRQDDTGMSDDDILSDPVRKDLYTEKVNTFAYGVPNPVFQEKSAVNETVSALDDYDTKMGEINNNLSDLAWKPTDIGMTPVEQQMADMLGDRMDDLTTYNDQIISSIQAQTNRLIEAQKQQNELNQKSSAWELAKMGALGTTMSGSNYLLQVEAEGKAKIAKLAQEGNEALLEARKAIADDNFKLGTQMIEFALDVDDRIRKEKQQQFDNQIKLQGEQRKQEAHNRDVMEWAQEDMANLASLDINKDEFTEQDKREIEAKAGYPAGTFDEFYDVVTAEAEAATYEDKLDVEKKKYDILKGIPEDKAVMLNGVEYTGLKEVTPRVYEQVITDKDGTINLMTYDENTGEMKVTDTGIRTVAEGASLVNYGNNYGGGGGKGTDADGPTNSPFTGGEIMAVMTNDFIVRGETPPTGGTQEATLALYADKMNQAFATEYNNSKQPMSYTADALNDLAAGAKNKIMDQYTNSPIGLYGKEAPGYDASIETNQGTKIKVSGSQGDIEDFLNTYQIQ